MTLQRRDIATIAIDHRGNVAIGPGHNTVEYQLKQQRKMQDRLSDTLKNTVKNPPTTVFLKRQKKSEYEIAKETIPNRIRLAKELQRLYKPVSEYKPRNHKYRSSPWQQIYNAQHMKVDTSEYWSNHTYFSKLYKSMKTASIPHQDILAVWGNPYIGTVTRWDEISYQRRQNLTQQYPEIEQVAESIAEQKRDFYDKVWWNISNPTRRFLDEYAFAISAIASVTPYGRAYSVVRGAVAIAPKLGQLITTLGSVELARQFQILYKKTSGNDTPNPRLGTSGFKEGQYWDGLNPVNTSAANRQIGKINKQAFGGGEVRTDGKCIYRFDQGHQTAKIHIERYKKVKNNHWRADAECDPQTGEPIPGSIDKLSKKPRHIKW